MNLLKEKKYLFFIFLAFFLFFIFYLFTKESKIKKNIESPKIKEKQNISISFKKKEERNTTNLIKKISKNNDLIKRNKEFIKKTYYFLFEGGTLESKKLFNAILNNNYEYINLLHKKGIKFKNLTKNYKMILEVAAYTLNDFRILDILIEQGLPIIKTIGRNCFQTALEARNFKFLEYLINEKDYNINYKVDKLSLKMQALGHKDLEKWVEKNGGEYNLYDEKNVLYAVKDLKSKKDIKRLINEGFIFNNEQLAKLVSRSSMIGGVELLSYLHENFSIDQTFTHRYKNNALHLSVYSKQNNLEITKWLLKEGYNPNQKNKFGEDMLGMAARNKKEDLILYLLKKNHMEPFNEINIRGKLVNKTDGTFEIKKYKNLYLASKKKT